MREGKIEQCVVLSCGTPGCTGNRARQIEGEVNRRIEEWRKSSGG